MNKVFEEIIEKQTGQKQEDDRKQGDLLKKLGFKVGTWEFPKNSEPFYIKIGKWSVTFAKLDMGELPSKKVYIPEKKQGEGEKQGKPYYYYYLQNVELYRYWEGEEKDKTPEVNPSETNLVLQFGDGTYNKLRNIFAKNKNGHKHLLIYRFTERVSEVKEISEQELGTVIKMSKEEIIEKYFDGKVARKPEEAQTDITNIFNEENNAETENTFNFV